MSAASCTVEIFSAPVRVVGVRVGGEGGGRARRTMAGLWGTWTAGARACMQMVQGMEWHEATEDAGIRASNPWEGVQASTCSTSDNG